MSTRQIIFRDGVSEVITCHPLQINEVLKSLGYVAGQQYRIVELGPAHLLTTTSQLTKAKR